MRIWDKKGVSGNFNNPMGSLDLANLYEPIGCLLLYNLNIIIEPCKDDLYRDKGSIIVDNYTFRKGDMIRKRLHWFGLKLDIQINLNITDYLDITFN